jgi:hypothetical protein
VLAEPDILRLIIGSNLPAAGRFERWAFEEVLPTIRRTGSYNAPPLATAIPPRGGLRYETINPAAASPPRGRGIRQGSPIGNFRHRMR